MSITHFFKKCCCKDGVIVDPPVDKCSQGDNNCLPVGNVTTQQWKDDVFNIDIHNNGSVYSQLTSVAPCGYEVLYPAGAIGGASAVGGQWETNNKGQEKWLTYCIEFDADFDFVIGGKMPGIGGGSTPTGGVGADCSGYTLRMQWGGGSNQSNMIAYLYWQGQSGQNSGNNPAFGDVFPLGFDPQQGTKYEITMGVNIGTPGNNDGWFEVYVNGTLYVSQYNMMFMCPTSTYSNDKFVFSTFYGGGSAAWAPQTDQTAVFSGFCYGETKEEVE